MKNKLLKVLQKEFGLEFAFLSDAILEKNIQAILLELDIDENGFYKLLEKDLNNATVELLAKHFLINESYFFRDKNFFDGLKKVLKELIKKRELLDMPYLRIWSSACSMGQEPYSIAILLLKLFKDDIKSDIKNWNITILATDLNEQNLQKAKKGIYTQWSFRDTPPWIFEYFKKDASSYHIDDNIKKMVRFKKFNLIKDTYPSFLNDTVNMDIIVCRNVLLYFEKKIIKECIDKFYECLSDDGFLNISSVEYDFLLLEKYKEAYFNNALFFKKDICTKQDNYCIELDIKDDYVFQKPDIFKSEYISSKELSKESQKKLSINDIKNEKDILKALDFCEELLKKDPKNIELNYYYAHLLIDQNQLKKAVKILEKIIYLDDTIIMAYITLGFVYSSLNICDKSLTYIKRAKKLLQFKEDDEIIYLSEDMSAVYLSHMIERFNCGR